jgi:hypothetical protein
MILSKRFYLDQYVDNYKAYFIVLFGNIKHEDKFLLYCALCYFICDITLFSTYVVRESITYEDINSKMILCHTWLWEVTQ